MKFRHRPIWLTILFFIFHAHLVAGQDVSVSAEVEPNPVGLEDQLSLTIKITGPAGSGENPQMPKIEGLTLVAGPSISRSFQWINGNSSSSQSYTYLFEPQKEGEFRIPAISIHVAGKVYRTKEIDLKVVKDSGQGRANAPRKRSPFSIFDDMGLDEDSPLRGQTPRRSDVFVISEIDKKKVYVGEQVTLTYKVLSQIPVLQVEMRDNPPLSGFWAEEIDLPKSPDAKVRVLQGKQYAEYVVKQQALFPTRNGNTMIPASTFSLAVRTSAGGFFALANQTTVLRKTDPLPIMVEPLPETGRPAGFNGAVGEFKLDSSIDKARAETGEALSLKVRLSGRGNFRTITDFPLPDLPGFKVFSSKSRDELSIKDNHLQGSKIWEYVIVPQAPGKERIPDIEFAYFSTVSGHYQQIRASGMEVAVVQGKEGARLSAGIPAFTQQSLFKRSNDINYLKLPTGKLKDHTSHFYQSYWFCAFVFMPFLFNVALLFYGRKQARWEGDLAGLRSRRARKTAEKRLAQARRCLVNHDHGQFHGILLSSITGYLSDKFSIPQIDITAQQVRRFMERSGFDSGLANELVGLMEACNFARYAPVTQDKAGLELLFTKAREIIVHLERETR